MDLIIGDKQVRIALEGGADILDLERGWQDDLNEYEDRCRSVSLYDTI